MNTNADNWFTAIVEGNRLTLLAKPDVAEMWFMSASCLASALERTSAHSFSLIPNKDKKGMVAVKIWYQRPGKNGQCGWLYYLLPLTYNQEPFAELNTLRHPFLPSQDNCLAQLCENGLHVTVGEKRFVSPDFSSLSSVRIKDTNATWTKQGIRIVPDANLLCRFLVDEATLEQVEAAAEAIEQEQAWPAQRDELKQQIAALTTTDIELKKIVYETTLQRDRLGRAASNLLKKLEDVVAAAQSAGWGSRAEALRQIGEYADLLPTWQKALKKYK